MSWLIENTAICLALAGVVTITVRIARPRPAVAHLMWLCVLLSLIAPRVVRWAVPLPAAPAIVVAAEPVVRPAAVPERGPRPAGAAVSTADDRGPPVVLPSVGATARPLPWSTILVTGWVFGAVALLGLAGVAAARQHRRIQAGSAPSAALVAEVRDIAGQLGIRAPRTRIVAGVETPFVWALGQPTLVWPANYAARDATRRRIVIAHELAHVRRGDHWIARAECVAAAGLWWHPLFWFARSQMREQAELACDAWAIWTEPSARHAYAGALIDALESRSRTTVALPALGARPRSHRAFEKRLMMILHDDVPRRLSARALAPVAALTLAAFSGFSFAQEREGADPAAPPRAERQVGQEVRRTIARELRNAKIDAATIREVLGTLDRELERAGSARRRTADAPPAARSRTRGREFVDRGEDARDQIAEQDPPRRRAAPSLLQIAIRLGLDEARHEIRNDADLRRLGLTQDVETLLDAIADGGPNSRGFDRALSRVIQQGLRAGIAEAKTELRQDEDLRRLGLDKSIEALLDSLADGGVLQSEEFSASIRELVRDAMREGMEEAREAIGDDDELRRLGLTDDVLRLLDTFEGGEGLESEAFGHALQDVVEGAIEGGLRQARTDGLDPDVTKAVESILQEVLRGETDLGEGEKELQAAIERLVEDAAERARQDETASRRRQGR